MAAVGFDVNSPREKVLSRLTDASKTASGWQACCPAHDDAQPSLCVSEGDDGRLLLFCQAGCSTVSVVHALGLTMSELFPPREPGGKGKPKRHGKLVASYDYRDADGVLVYQARRYALPDGKKDFRQCRPNGQGGWIFNTRGIDRVLYRLPELIASAPEETIWIAEGEKKVDALREWGLVATCNVGGAGKWTKKYSEFLRNRRVIILPDNDPINPATGECPGKDHAKKIIDCTTGIAHSISVLELPGLPVKGDVVDWIAAGGTLSQLLELSKTNLQDAPSATVATAPPPTDPLSLAYPETRTDLANARRMLVASGDNLRYCHPWKKWMVWDGKRWKPDDTGQPQREAVAVSDRLWEEARDLKKSGLADDEEFAKMMSFARYSASSKATREVLQAASNITGYQILPEQMDADPWLLNVQNGTIDLHDGSLKEHDRAQLMTKICPIEYQLNQAAECPVWISFLNKVMDNDPDLVSYLQRLCGYWLTGIVREQMLPILWGDGANGKTTFINVIMDILGMSYSMKAPADFLMAKRTENHPTEKADLHGKRFVACSETKNNRGLDESMVKELTGTERIRARRMREDSWEFFPTHKIVLCTNHRPTVDGADHGIWRRLRLIPFTVTFWDADKGEDGPAELRQDKTLPDRLKEEYPAILAWMVKGCLDWSRYGEGLPDVVKLATGDYQQGEDVLAGFFEECCVIGASYRVSATDLYRHYTTWANVNHYRSVNQKNFGLAMASRKFQKTKNSVWYYLGIAIAVNADDDPSNGEGYEEAARAF